MRDFNKEFDKQVKFTAGLMIFMIVLKLAVIGGLIYVGFQVFGYIGEHGLRNIAEQLLNGVQ